MVEDRVLAIESGSESGKTWDGISLESSMSSPNPDAIDGYKHNSATMPYLESYCWILDHIFLHCYILRIVILNFIIFSSCTQCTFLIQEEYCVSVYVF
jgi:hypothetical protein